MNVHLSVQTIGRTALLIMLIGLLVIAAGAYVLIDAKNRYQVLADLPQPSQAEIQNLKPGDPMVMTLAAIDRDKRELEARQGLGTSLIGIGAVVLGVAVLIYMRLPEQNPKHA